MEPLPLGRVAQIGASRNFSRMRCQRALSQHEVQVDLLTAADPDLARVFNSCLGTLLKQATRPAVTPSQPIDAAGE
jgi:hypothetical protein